MSAKAETLQLDVKKYVLTLGQKARTAAREIARADTALKNQALNAIADNIDAVAEQLKQANTLDLKAGKDKGLDDALLDRLELTCAIRVAGVWIMPTIFARISSSEGMVANALTPLTSRLVEPIAPPNKTKSSWDFAKFTATFGAATGSSE